MLFGLFGWKIAGLNILAGLVIAITAGFIIGRLIPEFYVEDFIWQVNNQDGPLAFYVTLITSLCDTLHFCTSCHKCIMEMHISVYPNKVIYDGFIHSCSRNYPTARRFLLGVGRFHPPDPFV
jgi:uncharacterized membrane protein YraQ (UPF0718 family)